MPINRFRGEHFFLSNFYPCDHAVLYDGDVFPTSEHAYQAAKIEERQGRDSFTCNGSLGDNPMHAKAKGGKVKKRPNWDRMKCDVMLEAVRSNFARDDVLQQKLLATQNQKIVEGHTGDKFWGGKVNHLGNILMRVRGELRAQHQLPAMRPSPVCSDAEGELSPIKEIQRSKGSSDRQAIFQSQLDSWMDKAVSTSATEAIAQVDRNEDVDAADAGSCGSGSSRFSTCLPTDLVLCANSLPHLDLHTSALDDDLPRCFVVEGVIVLEAAMPQRPQEKEIFAWLSQHLSAVFRRDEMEALAMGVEVILGNDESSLVDLAVDAADMLRDVGVPENIVIAFCESIAADFR